MAKLIVAFLAVTGALSAIGVDVWNHSQPYTVTAYFASAEQLVPGNDVVLAGVPVGRVDSVAVADEGSQAGAVVRFSVDSGHFPLKSGTHANIRPKGILGTMFVELVPGSGRPIASGGTIPLQDTTAPVTLDQVNDLFDQNTRDRVHNLTIEGGRTFAGAGKDVNQLLNELPAISQDAADISAALAQRDQALNDLAIEFDRVAQMMADEDAAFKRDIANGASFLQTLAAHQQQIQAELVYANSTLAKLNSALGGHEQDLNQLFKEFPGLLDQLRSFQDHSTVAFSILSPCIGDILTTLAEMQGAMDYKTPAGATDGQGYELRTYSEIARLGNSVGSYAPAYACSGSTANGAGGTRP